jgi:hypothetical protein
MQVATAALREATNKIKALLTFGLDCNYKLIGEIFYRKCLCRVPSSNSLSPSLISSVSS